MSNESLVTDVLVRHWPKEGSVDSFDQCIRDLASLFELSDKTRYVASQIAQYQESTSPTEVAHIALQAAANWEKHLSPSAQQAEDLSETMAVVPKKFLAELQELLRAGGLVDSRLVSDKVLTEPEKKDVRRHHKMCDQFIAELTHYLGPLE